MNTNIATIPEACQSRYFLKFQRYFLCMHTSEIPHTVYQKKDIPSNSHLPWKTAVVPLIPGLQVRAQTFEG